MSIKMTYSNVAPSRTGVQARQSKQLLVDEVVGLAGKFNLWLLNHKRLRDDIKEYQRYNIEQLTSKKKELEDKLAPIENQVDEITRLYSSEIAELAITGILPENRIRQMEEIKSLIGIKFHNLLERKFDKRITTFSIDIKVGTILTTFYTHNSPVFSRHKSETLPELLLELYSLRGEIAGIIESIGKDSQGEID